VRQSCVRRSSRAIERVCDPATASLVVPRYHAPSPLYPPNKREETFPSDVPGGGLPVGFAGGGDKANHRVPEPARSSRDQTRWALARETRNVRERCRLHSLLPGSPGRPHRAWGVILSQLGVHLGTRRLDCSIAPGPAIEENRETHDPLAWGPEFEQPSHRSSGALNLCATMVVV